MKTLYEFEVKKTIEVDDKQTSKDASGTDVVTIKKVKKEIPHAFAIKKPTRAEIDDGDLYYSEQVNKCIQRGFLTRALLAKRLDNDGWEMSENDKKEYVSLYQELIKLEQEYKKLQIEGRGDSPEQKEIQEKLISKRREIIEIETRREDLFGHTAEAKAENRTLTWWVLNLAYRKNEKGEFVPVFAGERYEDKLDSYDELIDSDEEFYTSLYNKYVLYIVSWYRGFAKTPEDFKRIDREFLREVLPAEPEEKTEEKQEAAVS